MGHIRGCSPRVRGREHWEAQAWIDGRRMTGQEGEALRRRRIRAVCPGADVYEPPQGIRKDKRRDRSKTLEVRGNRTQGLKGHLEMPTNIRRGVTIVYINQTMTLFNFTLRLCGTFIPWSYCTLRNHPSDPATSYCQRNRSLYGGHQWTYSEYHTDPEISTSLKSSILCSCGLARLAYSGHIS